MYFKVNKKMKGCRALVKALDWKCLSNRQKLLAMLKQEKQWFCEKGLRVIP